jgi:predicted phage terminase large subunit-like protein
MDTDLNKKTALLEELELLLSRKRYLACRNDFPLFVRTYLSNLTPNKSADFHLEIMGLLGRTDIDIKRLLITAPRGFAKSRLNSIFFPIWLALYGKKSDVFLVSATISLAKELLRIVRTELESNELILKDFGVSKSDKWTEEHLILLNGVNLRAKGRGFQIRGFRPDVIICDDLEDEEIIYSKEQRDKLEQWFFRTLLPALKPDQALIYVGTKLHQFSLICKLQEKEEFVKREYKALVDGKSIWEALWTTDNLNKIRREIGEYAFQAEYQNNPISLEEQPIKPHYLQGVVVKGNKDAYCLAIDPAISERTGSDRRAIVLFARTDEGFFKEIFSEAGFWNVTEQIERIIHIWETNKLQEQNSRIVVESVAFQKIFKDDLIKEARRRKLWLPVTEAELGMGDNKRPKDKFTRLMQVAHLFEQKLVDVSNPDLIQELLAFPHGDKDDFVDATVYALYWLMKFRSGSMMQKKEVRNLPIETKQGLTLKEVRPDVWAMVNPDKSNPSGFINLKK